MKPSLLPFFLFSRRFSLARQKSGAPLCAFPIPSHGNEKSERRVEKREEDAREQIHPLERKKKTKKILSLSLFTCIVTSLPSTATSRVRKSAPIVALYACENFFDTYWFISEVLPTLGFFFWSRRKVMIELGEPFEKKKKKTIGVLCLSSCFSFSLALTQSLPG